MSDKRLGRIKKELERLKKDPPDGVSCWPKDGRLDCFEAKLMGAKDTPYSGGIFKLEIRVPDRYPFEPPQVQFMTKIYHPNIDTAGRICLDVLKSPPQGSWKPSQNISTILSSIQLLLSEPNPDDGLMAEISHEFKHNRPSFLSKAKEWVDLYAKADQLETNGKTESDVNSLLPNLEKSSEQQAGVPGLNKTDNPALPIATVEQQLGQTESNATHSSDSSGSVFSTSAHATTTARRKGLSRKRKGPALTTEDIVPAKKSHSNA